MNGYEWDERCKHFDSHIHMNMIWSVWIWCSSEHMEKTERIECCCCCFSVNHQRKVNAYDEQWVIVTHSVCIHWSGFLILSFYMNVRMNEVVWDRRRKHFDSFLLLSHIQLSYTHTLMYYERCIHFDSHTWIQSWVCAWELLCVHRKYEM